MFQPSDEHRQEPNVNDPAWVERFSLLSVGADWAVWAELTIVPHHRVAQFRAAVLRSDELPIVLVASEIPAPSSGLEVRASGIWAELVCEKPLEHWSYGLEAFALALDSPTELATTGMGHRVPLGWELDFEASSPPSPWGGGYRQAGEMHGLLLTEDGEIDVEGTAVRGHSWGAEPSSSLHLPVEQSASLGWVAVPGRQPVTVGRDAAGVSVI